jgi:multiple sugar transport system ATP-binding protein
MIYVTHDQVEAMTMADKIVVLQGGIIEQTGSPLELYHHPRNQFVAGFIGSPKMNFLPATVARLGPDRVTVALPSGTEIDADVRPEPLHIGEPVTLGVRPEHLVLAQDGQVRGEVVVAERLGGETFLYAQLTGGDLLTIQADGNNAARVHDRVGVRINSDACHLFNRAGEAIPRTRRNPLADMRHPTMALRAAQQA